MAPAPDKRKMDLVDLTHEHSSDDDLFETVYPARKMPRAEANASQAPATAHPVYQPSASYPSARRKPFADRQPSASQSNQHYASYSRQPYPTPPFSSQPSPSSSFSAPGFTQRSKNDHGQIRTGLAGSESFVTRDAWLDEEDVRGQIDLTQDDDDDVYGSYELYGIYNTKIVGIRFYSGRATVGEYVVVKREPENRYDSNAVQINNVMGDQIGHLSRECAAKLAPLMDSQALLVEGALTGPKGAYTCPIGLKIFGTTDPRAATDLKQQMIAHGLPVTERNRAEAERRRKELETEKGSKASRKVSNNSRKRGGVPRDIEPGSGQYANLTMPGSSAPTETLEQVMETAQSYNPREVQNVVNAFGAGEDVLSQMPRAEQPSKLETRLLPYQLQGLKWMLDKESPTLPSGNSSDVVQLWKRYQGGYLNIATSFFTNNPPLLAKGGVLADDMGLGKTIQVISLIMSGACTSRKPSLIIAPLSVMSNWSTQAQKHVAAGHVPKILIYHGAAKANLRAADFASYDIVITTYQTMALELFPSGASKAVKTPATKGLFSTSWRRIVLDEGHQIRNPKAKMAQAACALEADARWILTGTPIVNNLKDLYSHVKFLRMTGGLEQLDIFNGTLTRPMRRGDANAGMLLRALMSTICLRRMKDMKFVDLKLPELVSHKFPIKFHAHERKKYDAFAAQAKGLVAQIQHNEGNNTTFTNLLEVLLRMRQCCNHWKLCGSERVQRILALVEENKVIDVSNEANRQALQVALQLKMDSQEECPICMDSFREPVITACAHAFCNECVERVIQEQHKCPMCRSQLADTTSLVPPAAGLGEADNNNNDDDDDDDDELDPNEADIDPETTSSKIEALIKIIKASSQTNNNTKTVIFSQWTSFLDLLQTQLHHHLVHLKPSPSPSPSPWSQSQSQSPSPRPTPTPTIARIDGKMAPQQRDAAIQALDTDPNCTILLASLSVCSVGLNLVAANQVILADSWWAPAIEDQAVDRVHRLGQRRKCTVIRLVMEDSVEEEVLDVQRRKRRLMGQAFGEGEEGEEGEGEGVGRGGGSGNAGVGTGGVGRTRRGVERRSRLRDIEMLLR